MLIDLLYQDNIDNLINGKSFDYRKFINVNELIFNRENVYVYIPDLLIKSNLYNLEVYTGENTFHIAYSSREYSILKIPICHVIAKLKSEGEEFKLKGIVRHKIDKNTGDINSRTHPQFHFLIYNNEKSIVSNFTYLM